MKIYALNNDNNNIGQLIGTVVPESLDLHSEKQADSDVSGSIPQG